MHWLTHNWQELLPQPWTSIALVFTALLCGGIVGGDFERKQKSVGLRTLMLVSFGSAVFTMINVAVDFRTPIAGQIVSGIGFLCSGVILRGSFGITGLTSAATIWAMAAIGMTVGIGYAGAGLALSVLLLGSTAVVSAWEHRFFNARAVGWVVLTYRHNGGKTLIKIREALISCDFPASSHQLMTLLPTASENIDRGLTKREQLRVKYSDTQLRHREFLAYVASLDEVEEIRHEPLEVDVSV